MEELAPLEVKTSEVACSHNTNIAYSDGSYYILTAEAAEVDLEHQSESLK